MPDISITVTDKRPVCTAGTTVVCDNSDYIVHWDLDEEWSAYDTKTMRVIYMDSTYADTVFTGDSVALPPVPVPGCVQIGLYAGDIHTSRMAFLRALSSVRSASGAPANPAPDVYDQLMELIKGMGSVDPDDIAKAVADYLAAHPIEETDPTVPAWAKAETKPTYSAAEVGAIAQSDLQAATDAALAQAKASGEFDGPRGPAGAPGKDGSDATVTAENIAGALGYTPAAPSDIPVVPAAEIRANTAARHSHKNKAVIDGITGQVTADKVLAPDHTTDLVQYGAFQIAAQLIINQIPTVPTALKNPNALTIKIGSTIVTYDGSSAETVEIADGTEVSY